jgi:DegV family protein with EDD domain
VVSVVTDSASNLPPGLADEFGIHVVPLWLRLGEAEFRDGVDLAPGDFYQRLAADETTASTAAPAPERFLEAFDRSGDADVVCVTVAATMSAVHRHATAAAERFGGRAVVVDSMNASMAEGFVVLAAARTAADGAPADQVVEAARRTAAATSLFATVNTFRFLKRSGRVTRLQAYAATMLDINPVFAFSGGDPKALARPRTRRRAVARLAEEVTRAIGHARAGVADIAVLHAAVPEEAADLLTALGAIAGVRDRHLVEVTPVIGAHTGPGLLGAAVRAE